MLFLKRMTCLAVVLLAFSAYAREANVSIPDLPSADMRMGWQDFKTLLELLQKDEAAPPAEAPPPPPPVPWTYIESHYKADASPADSVRIEARLAFQVWSNDWVQIPVIGAAVGLESVMVDGEPGILTRDEQQYVLPIQQPGIHELTLIFHVEKVNTDGTLSLNVPVVPTPVTRMNLRIPEPDAVVAVQGSASATVTPEESGLVADIIFKSADSLNVRWQLPARIQEEEPAQDVLPPRFTANVKTSALISESYMALESTIELDVHRGALDQFVMRLPKTTQLLDVVGKGVTWEAQTVDGDQQINVAVNHAVSGEYVLQLRYEEDVPEKADSIVIPALTVEGAARQTGYIAVASNGAVDIGGDAPLQNAKRIEVAELPKDLAARTGSRTAHAFRYSEPGYVVTLKEIAPHFTVMSNTLATVSDSFIGLTSEIRMDVHRGAMDRLSLRLPGTMQVLEVTGKGANWESKTVGEQRVLEIVLSQPVSDHYTLQLRYEQPIQEGAASVTVPRLFVDGAVRQTGFIAVATSGNVELGGEAPLENAKRVDISDLPATLVSLSQQPVLHAFRFGAPEHLIALDFQRLDDVPVRVAGIDHARITTVVTHEGMQLTDARYKVRNHHKKFLRVDVGADAEVWSAQVAGEIVRPARNDDNSAILIPLRKSTAQASDRGAFEVVLVYMRQNDESKGVPDKIQVDAPRTDLMINEFTWEVLLPEDRAVSSFEGDLNPVRTYETSQIVLDALAAPNAQTEVQRIFRLREGIERFFVTDINSPSATAGGPSRYDGTQDTQSERPLSGAQVAGVKPIEVDVPRVGIPHRFKRTIVAEDMPLTLTFETFDRRYIQAGMTGLQLALFAFGSLSAIALWRLRKRKRAIVAMFLLLLFPAALAWVGLVAAGSMAWLLKWYVAGALLTLCAWALSYAVQNLGAKFENAVEA